MTPAALLDRAEHAIRTGQPMLAMTYLRRAEELLDERAAEYTRWRIRHVFGSLGRAMQQLPRAFEEAGRHMAQMITGFNDYYDRQWAEIEARWDRA